MLLLRGRVPLYTCELKFAGLAVGDSRSVNLWFRHAVLCDVRVLRLNAVLSGIYVELDDLPLVSRHLVKLQLAGANLVHGFLDFSSCPVLEHLEIVHCDLSDAKKISSQSLKRLRITYCSFSQIFRTCIHVPNLLSLRLDDYWYRTPVFEVMPLLVEAVVRAENLVLIAEHQEFIFKRDLIRCPAFSKLKTLLLIDCCCVAFNFHGISCILRHSPVLEKLTLEFSSEEPENELEMKGSCSQMERSSAISKHLKLVEVKCEVIDERVIKVLKYLSAFNICKALACILEHSPVLRKFSLKISKMNFISLLLKAKSMMEIEENDNQLWKPAVISEHLR
uniref:F-box family-1 n=1 Tax=Oryza ridleyi TaxID=83308 RepID=E0CWC1_9ORYZ|nr:F-box family-1 [Oryza ridleyi]